MCHVRFAASMTSSSTRGYQPGHATTLSACSGICSTGMQCMNRQRFGSRVTTSFPGNLKLPPPARLIVTCPACTATGATGCGSWHSSRAASGVKRLTRCPTLATAARCHRCRTAQHQRVQAADHHQPGSPEGRAREQRDHTADTCTWVCQEPLAAHAPLPAAATVIA